MSMEEICNSMIGILGTCILSSYIDIVEHDQSLKLNSQSNVSLGL